jgi:hypothetical protein
MAYGYQPENGPVAIPFKPTIENKFIVIDGKVCEIKKVVVHRFRMGDVDDPDLYAAEPLYQWQCSEMGKWVMARAVDTPEWHRQPDLMQYGYEYAIVAKLKDIDYTFWQLKWGNDIDSKR